MNTPKLVTVTEILKKLGHSTQDVRRSGATEEYIKKYKIEVVTEAPWGAGVMRFMTAEAGDLLVAKHGPKESKSHRGDDEEDPQLHIIALEELVRKQTATLQSNTDAMQLLLKQNNILCDRLLAVLKDLGIKDPV